MYQAPPSSPPPHGSTSVPTAAPTTPGVTVRSSQRNQLYSSSANNPQSSLSAFHHSYIDALFPRPSSPALLSSLRPSLHPLPYPAAYPPYAPHVAPASQTLTSDRPHRYVVCRTCNTIILVLRNLPTSVRVIRHFSDATPVSASQTFSTPLPPKSGTPHPSLHKADALAWLRKPLSGLLSYNNSADLHSSSIPLACRTCQDPSFATLLLVFDIVHHRDQQQRQLKQHTASHAILDSHQDEGGANHELGEERNGRYSCAYLTFRKWAVSFSDAYGREILAAAEAQGFWNFTPAPYAARPFK